MKRDAWGNPFKGSGSRRPNATYPSGRRCSRGCPTILNRYNPGPECLRCQELSRDVGGELEDLVREKVH